MDKKDIKLFVILTLVVIVIISFFVFGDIGQSKQQYVSYREEKQEYEQEEQESLITYMKVSNPQFLKKTSSYYFVAEVKNTYSKRIKGVMKAILYKNGKIVDTETIFLPNDGLGAGETFTFDSFISKDEKVIFDEISYSDSSLRVDSY